MRPISSRWVIPLTVFSNLIAILLWSGCFNSTEVAKLVCNQDSECPLGYQCIVKGLPGGCCKVGTTCGYDGAFLEARNEVEVTFSHDDVNIDRTEQPNHSQSDTILLKLDGAIIDVQGLALDLLSSTPDVPIGSPKDAFKDELRKAKRGEVCSSNEDCQDAHCIDKVCCDNACGAVCHACKQSITGQPDGICAPVTKGKRDPRENCAIDSINQCGNDGFCDGAGVCSKVGSDHICSASKCNASTFTLASTCDGKGACMPVVTVDCGASLCIDSEGCKNSCSLPEHCNQGAYCDATSSKCTAQKRNGKECGRKEECFSGFCVDGVCCQTDCSGCSACSLALTQKPSGQCYPLRSGENSRGACMKSGTPCGQDGTCDGNGNCHFPNHETDCGSTCQRSTYTEKTCNGAGTCVSVSRTCEDNLVCGVTICKSTCSTNNDCETGYRCSGKDCVELKKNGTKCDSGIECLSGKCVDKVCCVSGACPSCQACNLNGDGTCSNKLIGTADSGCLASALECRTSGCDGLGGCLAASSTVACGGSVCSNGPENLISAPGQWTTPVFTQLYCDGITPSRAGCNRRGNNEGCPRALVCASDTSCLSSCSRDADCGAGYYCNGGNCILRKAVNSTCTEGPQCESRRCSGGLCRECITDNDCPSAKPRCNNFVCQPCSSQLVGTYCNSDLTINCSYTNPEWPSSDEPYCGPRQSTCFRDGHCGCGTPGYDCPIGMVCEKNTCKVPGGRPCVTSGECAFGTCGADGLCPLVPLGFVCDGTGCQFGLRCGPSDKSIVCEQ